MNIATSFIIDFKKEGDMGDAFSWIADIIRSFGNLIPRLYLVRKNYGAIRYKYGKHILPMKPGLHIYWPIVTEIEEFPIARQTQNLETQVLMSLDRETVVVGGVIIYEIVDVVKALGNNYDINDTIGDIAMTSIAECITRRALTDILENLHTKIQSEFTLHCRSTLWEYGVKIHKASFTDFSTCIVIKNVGQSVTLTHESFE